MDANERLACLRDLAFIRELDEGFPSQRDCIDWANTVAPVLRFRRWPTQDECGLKTGEPKLARRYAEQAPHPAGHVALVSEARSQRCFTGRHGVLQQQGTGVLDAALYHIAVHGDAPSHLESPLKPGPADACRACKPCERELLVEVAVDLVDVAARAHEALACLAAEGGRLSPNRSCATPRRAPVTKRVMTPNTKLIIGAGPTGMHTALLLAEAGHHVKIVSRRGGTSSHPRIVHVALDASDAESLAAPAEGASTIFNCAMPRYDRWPQEFPPIAAAVLYVAERSGADLITLSNVYGYGRVVGPLTENLPMAPHTVKGRVRAAMWEAARAGSARATEVRASDYLGRGAGSHFTLMLLPRIVRGEVASFPGDLDAVHSWTFTQDVARVLVAASAPDASWV